MYKTLYTSTDKYSVAVDIRDDLTTVLLNDFSTGMQAKAHALRFFMDEYDENIGLSVAITRAQARLARKNEKYWIRQTRPTARVK